MIWTNKFNLPDSVAEAIKKNTYDVSRTDQNIISVTSLIGSPRIRQLTVRHWFNMTEDVSSGIWRLLGSAVHEVMGRISEDNRLIEERLSEEVDGMIVTGKADIYDAKTESIQDFKVTSVYKVKTDVEDWENQLNCYAWLCRKAGFTVKKLFVNAILRDWSKGQSKRQKNYPPFAYKKLDIPLWTLKKQEKYIKERVKIHKEAASKADKDLPLCSDEERWSNEKRKDIRCQEYCSAKFFCHYFRDNYEKKM